MNADRNKVSVRGHQLSLVHNNIAVSTFEKLQIVGVGMGKSWSKFGPAHCEAFERGIGSNW
jgi:hypothetical protein